MSKLKEKYQNEVVPVLKTALGLENSLAVPKVLKAVVSLGIKEAAHDEAILKKAQQRISLITGQKPKICRARKSIASFKLGKGDPIGLMVTLRGKKMYDFLDKLFTVVLPRVRDYRGISLRGFDGRGNYTLGIAEQIVFPEAEFDRAEKAKGLGITIVTNAGNDQKAQKLLEFLGLSFRKLWPEK